MPEPGVRVFIAHLLCSRFALARWPIVVPAVSLADLLQVLGRTDEQVVGRLWDEGGSLRRDVILAHNGVIVARSVVDELRFQACDEVEFLAQFAGG